jgi:hypothetical protein
LACSLNSGDGYKSLTKSGYGSNFTSTFYTVLNDNSRTDNNLITSLTGTFNAGYKSDNFAVNNDRANLTVSLNTRDRKILLSGYEDRTDFAGCLKASNERSSTRRNEDRPYLTGGFNPSYIDNLIPGNDCRKGIRCKWAKAEHGATLLQSKTV